MGKKLADKNKVPAIIPIFSAIIIVICLIYSTAGLLRNDIVLGYLTTVVHFKDLGSLLIYGSFISFSILLGVIIIEYLDPKRYYRSYNRIQITIGIISGLLFIVALLFN